MVTYEGNTLAVDLSVTALVDKLADGLEVRLTVGNPRLDDAEHLHGGLVQANENTVVDLKETEKLQDLAGLRGDLVDTLDADNKDKLGLGRDVEGAILLGLTGKTDGLTLSIAVLLNVLLSTLEDNLALGLVGLFQQIC